MKQRLQNRGNQRFYIVENTNNLIMERRPLRLTLRVVTGCDLLIQELYQRGSIVWFTSG
jgi:hypothetical protein